MRSSRAPATKTTPLPAPRSAPENRDRLAQEGAVQDAIHTPGEYANDLIAESDFPTGDVDGDSLPDAAELAYFGNLDQTPDGDFDGDYATNAQEISVAASPADASIWPDSDTDGRSGHSCR